MSGETPLTCLKCAAPIARTPGSPGRPPRYCGDACKRLVEYEVRRLDRRIADYALEQRGLKYDGPEWIKSNERERQKRLRALRRWTRRRAARARPQHRRGRGAPARAGRGRARRCASRAKQSNGRRLTGRGAPALPALPGRIVVARDEPLPDAELEQITDPAELALCAGITRQAAHQRLQKRREPTP